MTELSPKVFAKTLRNHLELHKNPSNATAMEDYMKNHFRFFGIKTPERRALMRTFYTQYGHPKQEQVPAIVKELWAMPEREIHQVAQEIAGKYMKKAKPEIISLYEFMILNNSWWDTVDYIAIWLVGTLFKNHPEMIEEYVEKWMKSGNFWLQRTAILFQRNYKDETDETLLFGICQKLSGEKEFFIRKAIGWALREYAYTNPQAVLAFVKQNQLSPLSSKEALKHIKP